MRVWKLATAGLAVLLLAACVTTADIQPMPPIPPDLIEQIHSQPTGGCSGSLATPTANDYWRAYPARAMEQGIQGWVVLRIAVAPDGRLTSVQPVQSAPAGVFEAAAVGIISRLEFPAQPSECSKLILIQFRQAY